MGRVFEVRHEGELGAAPEAVFAAITVGTGGWMFPTEKVAAVGAAGPDGVTVREWVRGERLTLRMEGADGWFNQLEHRLTPRPGGRTWIDYVHSGVFADDAYELQLDACRLHTAFYQHSLDEYVRHFAGRPITYVEPAVGGSFGSVLARLGVAGGARAGDRVRISGPDGGIDAVVDYRTEHFLGLRADSALYRVFGREAWGMPTGVTLHLFDDGVDAAAVERAWAAHLG